MGRELTTKRHEGTSWGDGNNSMSYCHGGYATVYVCQNTQNCLPKTGRLYCIQIIHQLTWCLKKHKYKTFCSCIFNSPNYGKMFAI